MNRSEEGLKMAWAGELVYKLFRPDILTHAGFLPTPTPPNLTRWEGEERSKLLPFPPGWVVWGNVDMRIGMGLRVGLSEGEGEGVEDLISHGVSHGVLVK